MIDYRQGNLFSDDECLFLHACNCRGSWGRGVAAEFAARFPAAYAEHRRLAARPGEIQILREGRTIVCLFTSAGYGRHVDPPDLILRNTQDSLARLAQAFRGERVKIASVKINSGLFRVPWTATAALIDKFLDENPNFEWRVYSP